MFIRDEIRPILRNKLTEHERLILTAAVTARTLEPYRGFVVNEEKIEEKLFIKVKRIIREAEREL